MENKTDVIVIGAGPAGISCAITIARGGKNVILIERGDFAGAKNMFGGAIYTEPTREIFPNFEAEAPLERANIKNNYMILSENQSTNICYENYDQNNSYTVIRAKFDRWMAEQAEKEGVVLATNTCVRELILNNGCVVGVKTDLEEYFANIVVLADGVNSLLAKQIGLRKEIKPKDVSLAVKEVYKFPKEVIEQRFNLKDNQGCINQLFGVSKTPLLALGFIYTNTETITIGVGIELEDLAQKGLNPSDVLDEMKSHPSVAPLIEGGALLEYSAHLIPEAGYKKVPNLVEAGVMVIGDAAMLVNNLHWEGTNLAMISGKLAGEVAIEAITAQNFSKKFLLQYEQKLKKSFVMKDLKTYKDLINIARGRKDSFFGYYMNKLNEFFKVFTAVNGIPKRDEYRKFIKDFCFSRKLSELLKDLWAFIKLGFGVLK